MATVFVSVVSCFRHYLMALHYGFTGACCQHLQELKKPWGCPNGSACHSGQGWARGSSQIPQSVCSAGALLLVRFLRGLH